MIRVTQPCLGGAGAVAAVGCVVVPTDSPEGLITAAPWQTGKSSPSIPGGAEHPWLIL